MKRPTVRLCLGMAFIILLYGSFFVYLCTAEPGTPNDVLIQEDRATKEDVRTPKSIGPEFYLSEITTFYERVITVLSVVIGLILGLNFLYIHRTSKSQAEEMARDALEDESFGIILGKTIDERFIESKNKGDIGDILEEIENIDRRITLLEEQMNIQSYKEEGDEETGEVSDGNN